jgi:NADPH-dependent 2,4-dienoyl-CoA reductase/sulfur reductase-like enzyme
MALNNIVVIGAGIAGVSASEHLRALGYEGRLTLIGAEEQLPYDRPPLSKDLLLGKKNAAEVRLRPASWYSDNDIVVRLGVPVRELRAGEAEVVLSHGAAEPADAVVLATGGRARKLPVPGADHPAVTTLRTLAEAELLRDRLVAGTRVGIVGAGLIGAEVAASAVALGCDVTLLDPVSRPLERVVGAEIADALHAQHRRNGVRLVEGVVTAVDPRGDGVRLSLVDSAVDCDLVVVGVGIEHDLSLATGAGLDTDRGVLVDHEQRTSHPRVFAAGDAARLRGGPPTEHWDGALREGRAAAAALLGRPAPEPTAPWFWSDRYGTHLEVIGEFAGATAVRGALGSDSFTAFAVREGLLVGAVAVNRPADMRAVRRLVDRRVPVDVEALGDESVDLRALVPPSH